MTVPDKQRVTPHMARKGRRQITRPLNLALAADHFRAASDLLAQAHEAGGQSDQAGTVGLAEYHVGQGRGLLSHWTDQL